MVHLQAGSSATSSEADLIVRALRREEAAVRTIVRENNRRLYRIARSILKDDSEAEDIVQEAYVSAFASRRLSRRFPGHLAFAHRHQRGAGPPARRGGAPWRLLQNPEARIIQFPLNPSDDPERTMAQRQILQLVERATDSLPDVYRTVFVARVIEGLSIEETAELLGVRPETVKTRLHRARHSCARSWTSRSARSARRLPVCGTRCERLTEAVMKRLGLQS